MSNPVRVLAGHGIQKSIGCNGAHTSRAIGAAHLQRRIQQPIHHPVQHPTGMSGRDGLAKERVLGRIELALRWCALHDTEMQGGGRTCYPYNAVICLEQQGAHSAGQSSCNRWGATYQIDVGPYKAVFHTYASHSKIRAFHRHEVAPMLRGQTQRTITD